ncbi:hypothetical protein M407DRAFT_17595 [Tulasnella calospora MUT 4182]|uniref:Zn(2)-C6 fungal-type domain-containing protein n=1 Tax=Tulasnella calospora MUT 4182 TaxID=1051891 RepID=A0A0C3QX87_9AGAM|nr:hypothetical protein M407DRAFT_17595 [Tulasnella calospora MUT 4182]
MDNSTEQTEAPPGVSEPSQEPPRRAYRAKGPTLGKGKACEYCRYRRIRCSGTRPICQNCRHGNKECVYLDKPRASTSTSALEVKLADLEERYRILSELEGAQEHEGPPTSSGNTASLPVTLPNILVATSEAIRNIPTAESARNWVASLELSNPPSPEAENPETVSDNFDDPWLDRTMSKSERALILKLYMREGFRYGVALVPPLLVEQVEDPDTHRRPHPCLFNAIVLVARDMATMVPADPVHDPEAPESAGSNFVIPESTPSDSELLARAQAHCSQSLGDVDRLQDYLQAMLLISYWFLRKGRLMEGQYSLAVACRLIINCKLHQIDYEVMQEMAPGHPPPQEGQSRWDRTLLGRPTTVEDLAIRIAIFWHSYYGDKVRSLLTGLPPTYDNDDTCHVTTAFPLDLQKYITGEAFILPHASCDSLFDGSEQPADNIQALPLKALTLLDYAIRYATRNFSRPQSRILLPATFELYQELNLSSSLAVDMDILGLQQSLNKFKESYGRILNNPVTFTEVAANRTRGEAFKASCYKTLIRLKGLATEIHLSYAMVGDGMMPMYDEDTAFNTRLRAAHECANVTAEAVDELGQLFGSPPPGYGVPAIEGMCMITGVLLAFASGVILEKIDKIKAQLVLQEPNPHVRQALEQEVQDELRRLRVMSEPIERIRTTYPIVDLHWQHIEKTRKENIDAVTQSST